MTFLFPQSIRTIHSSNSCMKHKIYEDDIADNDMHTRPDDQYIGLSRTDGSIRETNISPFRDTFPCSRRKTPSKSIYLTLLSFSESSTPLTHEMPTKNFTKRRGQHYGMIMCTTIHSTQLECTTLRLG